METVDETQDPALLVEELRTPPLQLARHRTLCLCMQLRPSTRSGVRTWLLLLTTNAGDASSSVCGVADFDPLRSPLLLQIPFLSRWAARRTT